MGVTRCSIIELITGADIWDVGDNEDFDEVDDLKTLMQQNLPPHGLVKIACDHPHKLILSDCVCYDASKRPAAIELIEYFTACVK